MMMPVSHSILGADSAPHTHTGEGRGRGNEGPGRPGQLLVKQGAQSGAGSGPGAATAAGLDRRSRSTKQRCREGRKTRRFHSLVPLANVSTTSTSALYVPLVAPHS